VIEPGDPARSSFGRNDQGGAAGGQAAAQAVGRYVVTFAEGTTDVDRTGALRTAAGMQSVMSTRDVDARTLDLRQAAGAEAVIFARLGAAVVSADADQVAALRATGQLASVRPSRVYRALTDPSVGPSGAMLSYLRGRRDEATDLCDKLAPETGAIGTEAAVESYQDTERLTWGLQAIGAASSRCRGSGVKVAVLDTGLDETHPDFQGRNVTARSFVPSPDVKGELQGPHDGHGHGTHCVGTACGPLQPAGGGRRYGVAYQAEIYVGKVLDDEGFGEDSSIIAGIEWALAQGCDVLSLSFGAAVRQIDEGYETIARRALDAGCLVVAAAGNNGNRAFGDPGFVEVPANSPSVIAVGAVDSRLRVADFSARSLPVQGGQVDLMAPGVSVYSSWPMMEEHRVLNGTSMATPHVAGVAALWGESTGRRGVDLWSTLVQGARRLGLASVDVGAGLVQAPSC
jgi:hypothetical protein